MISSTIASRVTPPFVAPKSITPNPTAPNPTAPNPTAPNPTAPNPPITIRSLLELSWGLSLVFSHDQNQRTLGTTLQTKIFAIFAEYQSTKYDPNDKISYYPTANTKHYFDNVILAMTKTIRNIGFVRNSHQNHLTSVITNYEKKEKFYNDLASFTSLSEAGLAPKIISFLGGGGVISVISDFGKKVFPKPDSNIIASLNATIQTHIENSTITDKTNEELKTLLSSMPSFPASDILFFILVGAFTLAAFNVASIFFKNYKLSKHSIKLSLEQREYYVNQYREDMILVLLDFHDSLLHLTRQFFRRDYDEDFDDVSSVTIDDEEFKMLYEGNSSAKFWSQDTENKNFHRLEIVFNGEKMSNAKKIEYFIRYKILPNWPTPVEPSKDFKTESKT